MTDPYSVLGVAHDASEDDIKTAYRKLAMKHHPDKNPGDADAENRFKEINAAYDSLKNGQKPQQQTFDFSFGFGGHSMEEILRGFTQQHVHRNRSYNTFCSISFADAFNGCEVSLDIVGKEIKIKIPAGVDNGTRIRVAGAGENVHTDIPPGDLYVTMEVQPDPRFGRDGKHLFMETEIDAFEAILGFKARVETIDNDAVEFDLPAGLQHGHKHRIAGKGMPIIGTSDRGDLFVIVKVTTPTSLTERQIELLTEIKGLSN
jgi:DnaJ-class molecular chaperone